MASPLDEIRRSVAGSLLVLQNRPEGLRLFDVSLAGFWRSFAVILLLVPLLVPIVVADRLYVAGLDDVPQTTAGAFYAVEAASMLLGWIAFPAIMVPVAKWLGLGNRYIPFIVVHNWTALLPAIPFAGAAVLYLVGLLSVSGFSFVALVVLAFEAYLRYRVARLALGASLSLAIAVTVLDLQLGILIDIGLFRLIGL